MIYLLWSCSLRFVYADFFNAMKWTRVGAIAEEGQELPEYHLELQEYLQKEGVSVLVKRKFLHNPDKVDLSQVSFMHCIIDILVEEIGKKFYYETFVIMSSMV